LLSAKFLLAQYSDEVPDRRGYKAPGENYNRGVILSAASFEVMTGYALKVYKVAPVRHPFIK
jgi:hypothetical protein